MLADLFKTKRDELNTSIFSSIKGTKKETPKAPDAATAAVATPAGPVNTASNPISKSILKTVPKDPGYDFTRTFIPKSRDIYELKCKKNNNHL